MSNSNFPIDLVLIRHGESEGNLAQEKAKEGDNSLWTQELLDKHNSLYRLTSLGQEQARLTGDWIREHIGERFDQYYCSEYIRAMETASLLGFEGARWYPDIFLREQDKGILEGQSVGNRQDKFEDELKRREREQIYFAPLGGESIAQCAQRIELWLFELERYCSGMRVIVVCHGDIMKAIRLRLERLKQSQWTCFQTDKDYKTHNCSVVHYSRRHPGTGDVHTRLSWVRSVCPWDTTKTSCTWKNFKNAGLTNNDLQNIVTLIPRYCDDPSRVTSLIKGSDKESEELVNINAAASHSTLVKHGPVDPISDF